LGRSIPAIALLAYLVAALLLVSLPSPASASCVGSSFSDGAIGFNGINTNSFVRTINSTASNVIANGVSFSINIWARRDSAASTMTILGAGTCCTNRNYLTLSLTSTQVSVDFQGAALTVATPESSDVNVWHMWTVTYVSSSKLRSIYVDGYTLVGSDTVANSFIGSGPIELGRHSSSGQYWVGFMDDLRIYAGRVLTLYGDLASGSIGVWPNLSNLRIWYGFNTQTGPYIYDQSGNNQTAVFPSNTTGPYWADPRYQPGGSNLCLTMPKKLQ